MTDAPGSGDDAPPGGDPGSRRFFADVLTFGWVLPAAIAAGAGLGWIFDRVFGLFPVLTAALGIVGLVARSCGTAAWEREARQQADASEARERRDHLSPTYHPCADFM